MRCSRGIEVLKEPNTELLLIPTSTSTSSSKTESFSFTCPWCNIVEILKLKIDSLDITIEITYHKTLKISSWVLFGISKPMDLLFYLYLWQHEILGEKWVLLW